MQSFVQVLSEYEEINSLLYKPINSSQRIKYTCFNTSASYIVLGSTSGSLYLFSREPCLFLHLIPLSEGVVSHISISPDEKIIALSTTRGSVCLVTIKPSPKLLAVSTEHVNEHINSLCWNDNSSEIYIGDGAGKVSVMVLSIFTVNGMFQAPGCVLMHLDSGIVQLNFSSPLLLASTLTRCYICNTVKEQYKQIGNKTRNGEFGASFYKTYVHNSSVSEIAENEEKLVNRMRTFSLISEGDNNMQEESPLTIFCARPGSRLWEVSVNGVVVKTHQFKEALAIPPTTICKSNVKASFDENQEKGGTWLPQSINFAHLFVIAEKYLFSYTSNGLYIMNPVSATVVLWCNEFSNISMAETIENKIYLMTSDTKFHCLTLSSLDSLILWLYNRKQYRDCLNVCLLHKSHLYKSIDNTELSRIYESETSVLQDEGLAVILQPIIQIIQSNLETCPVKLHSGIVVVNPGSLELKDEERYRYKSTIKVQISAEKTEMSNNEYQEIIEENSPGTINDNAESIKQQECDKANCNVGEAFIDEQEKTANLEPTANSNQNVTLRIQSDLEDIYSLANDIKSLMSERKLEIIIMGIQEKLKMIRDSYDTEIELKNFVYEVLRTAELYYFTMLLENIPNQLIELTNSTQIINQAVTAFVEINAQSCTRCNCSHPWPAEQLSEPKFLGVGKSLLKKISNSTEDCMSMCNKVPFMMREYLPSYIEKKLPLNDVILRQCLQTRDNVVLSVLLPLLDAKQWNIVVTCLSELKQGRCLFCANYMSQTNDHDVIDWSDITREVTKKQGPDSAMVFLTKVGKFIPNLSLDKSIFQSLIFTKILYQHGMNRAVDFTKTITDSSEFSTMCSPKVRDQLVEVLEKDLGKSIRQSTFGNGAHHWGMRYQDKSSRCPYCTLFLKAPLLLGNNGMAIFCCGHAYHVNCMIEGNLTTCILH